MEQRRQEGGDVSQPMARWRKEPGPARWDPGRNHKGACEVQGGESAGEQRDMNKIQAGCCWLSRQRGRPQPRRLQKPEKARKWILLKAPASTVMWAQQDLFPISGLQSVYVGYFKPLCLS